MIYLDNAATSKYSEIDDIIINSITREMKEYWENPSSLYASYVKEEINKCRYNIAKFIGAKPDEIYFTSGASESNNLAIRGWDDKVFEKSSCTNYIVTTPIEHKSILNLVHSNVLMSTVKYCKVDSCGLVDCDDLEDIIDYLKDNNILVSVCMANNEIGTVQHIKIISDIVHKYNGVLHVDATQALGHIPIDVKKLGIDMMSCSGHKISPILKGVGFLYKRNEIEINPLIYGEQEQGLRGGTENTFGITGLSKAIDYCNISNNEIEEIINKRNYFINLLETKFNCKLNGHSDYRLPNNINVTFPQNITGEALLWTLDLSDIQISVGSACNSKSINPSHVLKAIGLTDEEAMKTVRISISDDITYEEIDKVIKEIEIAIKLIDVNEGGEIDV